MTGNNSVNVTYYYDPSGRVYQVLSGTDLRKSHVLWKSCYKINNNEWGLRYEKSL